MELTHTAQRQGRLSSFLREEMGMSVGLMNRLKWKDLLFVNGTPQHTDYTVMPGDRITVVIEEPEPGYPAQDGEITVLYEDKWLLAVDKPAGMLVHPSAAVLTGTLANFVLGYYRRTGQDSAFHPITRLDRDTFGVVLLAKNAHVHALLNAIQDRGAFRKLYYARTYGGPEEDTGIIDAPIARKPLPSLLREIRPDGKPSRTEYRVLRRQEKECLLELRPVTGRTHQLRLHCAHMGYPILGDPQYGSPASLEYAAALGIATQSLCAGKLEFPHPITGEPMMIRTKFIEAE